MGARAKTGRAKINGLHTGHGESGKNQSETKPRGGALCSTPTPSCGVDGRAAKMQKGQKQRKKSLAIVQTFALCLSIFVRP
jgi:hypothetical protein